MKRIGNNIKAKLSKDYPTLDFSFEDDYREEVKILLDAQIRQDKLSVAKDLKAMRFIYLDLGNRALIDEYINKLEL